MWYTVVYLCLSCKRAAGTSLPEWDRPPYYGDDPNDHAMIKKGIQLYENRHK